MKIYKVLKIGPLHHNNEKHLFGFITTDTIEEANERLAELEYIFPTVIYTELGEEISLEEALAIQKKKEQDNWTYGLPSNLNELERGIYVEEKIDYGEGY